MQRSPDRFQAGSGQGVDVSAGYPTLLVFGDSFSGDTIDFDRWRFAEGNGQLGFELRQNNGLSMLYPFAYTDLIFSYNAYTYVPFIQLYAGNAWEGVEHRTYLVGDFDIQVSFANFQGRAQNNVSSKLWAMLQVADTSLEMAMTAPNNLVNLNVNNTVAAPNLQIASSFTLSGTAGTPVTASISATSGQLRIARTGTTVDTYYFSGGSWVLLQSATFVSATLRIALLMSSNSGIGTVTWSNFGVTGGTASYPTSGTYTSPVYDAGQTVLWDSITWDATTPTGTSVEFQIAVSNSPTGPFSFVGPRGTSGSYFTTSGTSIHAGTSGRYCQYQATLSGTGSATPTLNRVDVIYDGTNTSTEIVYSYDDAGYLFSGCVTA